MTKPLSEKRKRLYCWIGVPAKKTGPRCYNSCIHTYVCDRAVDYREKLVNALNEIKKKIEKAKP
jgi:hypothetical protein